MKRILCLFLTVMTIFTLAACGELGAEPTAEPTADPTAEPTSSQISATDAPTSGNETPNPTASQPTADKPSATPTKEQLALSQARADTKIGIWYAIWYDTKSSGSIWDNDGGTSKQPIYYQPLRANGTYGRYSSSDRKELNYHVKLISDAGIDFIIMDQTNDIDAAAGQWNVNALSMVSCIYNWNNQEGNRPLYYCSSIGALAELNNDMSIIEKEAKKLWERYIDGKKFGTDKYHLYVDGKPLMIIFPCTEAAWNAYNGDKTYANKFTIRFAEGHAYEPGYWGWVMPNGTLVNEDVACIIPGWYKYGNPRPKVLRDKGKTYKKNWETLLSSKTIPDFVVINSFNEYAEHTAVYTAKTTSFPRGYFIERWVDETGKENPSMYWDLTKNYIAKFRNGHRK